MTETDRHLDTQDDDNTETETDTEEPYATSAIFVNTEDAFTAGNQSEKSEKDLNSPDSNDSGIQADAQSFRHLSDDLELYAVVNKPKRKAATGTVVDHHASEESVTETEEPASVTSSKVNDLPIMKERKLDDPYEMVEFDSADEETGESPYAVIENRTRARRIVEKTVDDNAAKFQSSNRSHDDDDSDDKDDDDDKLSDSSDLPEGWQRHDDEQGPYYWHIKSGITQREPPSPTLQTRPAATKSNTKIIHSANGDIRNNAKTKKDLPEHPVVADVRIKPRQNVAAAKFDDSSRNGFFVHCLGSLPLSEDELSEDRSGHAINQCIASLSRQPGVLQNGRLQGRNLYLEFSGNDLLVIDVSTSAVVHSELLKSVRVWGVGKEKDSRDFAYVARDHESKKHVCWVFKCERTGHEVANALRGTCFRILKEDGTVSEKTSSSTRLNQSSGTHLVSESVGSKDWQKNQSKNLSDQSKKSWNGQSKHWNDSAVFPVPMSESKKIINCHYLGMMKVPKALGMDVLNDAIEMIYAGVPSSKWVAVSVEVAPSAVTVYDRGHTNSVLLECRIRFLPFLGIGLNNPRLCAFIMHSAQDDFFAHVFHCIPDAGQFCQTIKAACKLRYQKCLDAQTPKDRDRGKFSQTVSLPPFQGLKESLQKGVSNLFGGNNKKQQQKG